MNCIAIIPARGGSKSLPRKNVLPLAGKPLIAHTIEAARGAKAIDRVIVSTDDAEIKAIALQHGAEVIDRPVELASDVAPSESALIHALEELEKSDCSRPDLLVFLQCTSPFTTSADIDGLVSLMKSEQADTAFAAAPFHGFIWRQKDSDMVGINHCKAERLRRQDREKEYLETGAIYGMKVEEFIATKHRFFGKTIVYEMDVERALEIDYPEDFARAEMLIQERSETAFRLPHRVGAVIFDFDGVFTDDGVLVTEDGREAAMCSRRDGMGIDLLHKLEIPMIVISKERVPIVKHRCKKLGLEVKYGVDDKLSLMRSWLEENGINQKDTIFVGNDVNDLACMQFAGCSVAPQDAHPSAISQADIVLSIGGGKGAVRELADMICARYPQFNPVENAEIL